MSILSNIIAEVDKRQKESNSKSQLYDLEKTIREMAKSKGLMPRNFLIKIAEQNPKIANNRIIQHLIGEQDVPTQKGRDAKPEVLTKRAMNVVKKSIKHSANKQRRRMDKDSVSEDEAQDRGYAQMIIQQHQDEYKKFMDTGDLMDAPTIYEKLFAYFSSSDADDQMPYGTQKARTGDPYVWLVDKLDELGLIIEEGNEFAQKVRQLKATGAKKGTKFKTSDGEEHTLEQNPQQSKMVGSVSVQQIANQFPEVDDKNQLIQALMKVKQGQKISSLPQVKALAQAFRQMLGMDPMETQQLMTMMKRIETQEDVSDETIDSFHTELYKLVHKYFGHSPDEKREKQKMKEDDQGEVQVGSYQTKHFDICPSATKLYQDIDVEDMDLAERSAKLHDTLFYMEKHAMEMKKADPEYIEMMQNLADQIMAMAGMMGLESEHEYVQSHVDAVKNMKESVTESVAITEQEFDEQAGKKDACYHKVKARYKVWPSAYASGALVQCRKKGAANWGNKSK